jgi:hypothetical protein
LEFKNIILEEKLSNKLKNSHENFSKKMFMTAFEFIGTFFIYVFKLREHFSENGIRVIDEIGLGRFHTILTIQILDKPEVLKRFQKQF